MSESWRSASTKSFVFGLILLEREDGSTRELHQVGNVHVKVGRLLVIDEPDPGDTSVGAALTEPTATTPATAPRAIQDGETRSSIYASAPEILFRSLERCTASVVYRRVTRR